MCGCSWSRCIAPGTQPRCACECHAQDQDLMSDMIIARRQERCDQCRFAAYTCSRGLCFCECHADRPVVTNPSVVVEPGHDEQGHERTFSHVHIFRSVSPDLDRLIDLRNRYRPVHPEHTIGGAS